MAALSIFNVFNAEEISASASALSSAVDLGMISDIQGWFSLQLALTGDGTAKVQVAVSNDGDDFIVSSDASDDIVTAFDKTSGPGSDGKNIYQFKVTTARFIKIKITETGGSDSITVDAHVAVH